MRKEPIDGWIKARRLGNDPTAVPWVIPHHDANSSRVPPHAAQHRMHLTPDLVPSIIYAPIVKEHLRSIDRKYYTLIRTIIQERLSYEPTEGNRNRKSLKRPAFETATWELRFGPDNMFRVFYEIQLATHEVHILAIVVKVRDTVFIGGEAIEL
ncbi:hypothetical protein EYB53_006115 [Candidatus Chloroploca sp. M-50]|uniref:Addiction module toxin RelE n=1 Tax=Candidatus Chloroploca mongolica TaxID=2528176 RepID=A0ABS4D765_9CHLR|nr:hypothetical protein [Candidatus Chloroploca mongolica]MBP1465277.1 hypothetical protein [Candidatus Chloroploca mongolica]